MIDNLMLLCRKVLSAAPAIAKGVLAAIFVIIVVAYFVALIKINF